MRRRANNRALKRVSHAHNHLHPPPADRVFRKGIDVMDVDPERTGDLRRRVRL
jgi:hypothetical protein